MRKVISLFKRDYAGTRLVYDEVVPGAEWVIAGEGVATRKFDGAACWVKDGKLYKRYDVKKGRTAPLDFIPAQDPDETTGHWPGWIAVEGGNEDKWFRDAVGGNPCAVPLPDGTYELCGPKVQGNPERFEKHTLVPHGVEALADAPRTFGALRDYLSGCDIEGIVWHHPDGRMVKIKARDFNVGPRCKPYK